MFGQIVEPGSVDTTTTNTSIRFAAYVRQTLLKNRRWQQNAYSLRSPYNNSNVIELCEETERVFGWRIVSMKPTKKKAAGKYAYGVLIFGVAVGDDLRDVLLSNGLQPHFIVTADGCYGRHGTSASHWAFVPREATYKVHYSLAEHAKEPDWQGFDDAISSQFTQVLLGI